MGACLCFRLCGAKKYQAEYIELTEKVIKTDSTRGNIYDRNGNVLAYNELAYNVTVQDIGALEDSNAWNLMLWELVEILNEHGETVEGSLEIAVDAEGNVSYTSASEAARKRFLRDLYGLRRRGRAGRSGRRASIECHGRRTFAGNRWKPTISMR